MVTSRRDVDAIVQGWAPARPAGVPSGVDATVAQLWRYPVKSMQGERVDRAEVTERGLAGDRGYVVVDPHLGRVGSAKHPRLWGALLHATARYVDEPVAGAPPPPVAIDLPDGTTTRSDAPDVDARLSAFLGRPVHLATQAPADSAYLAVWPEVDGVMPDEVRRRAAVAGGDEAASMAPAAVTVTDRAEGTLAQHRLSSAAPAGTAFDVAALHLLTTATLARLGELTGGDVDVRRFRPNVVLDAPDAEAFAENEWTGRSIPLGPDGCAASVLMPTMRCIMTTLAQPGLERDPALLRTLTRANRVELRGGTWSCAGAYATVAAPGRVAVGDRAEL